MNWFKKYWKWIAIAIGLAALSVGVSFLPVGEGVESFTEWIRHLGLAGAFIFIGVYALAALCFLPGAIFTIAAGISPAFLRAKQPQLLPDPAVEALVMSNAAAVVDVGRESEEREILPIHVVLEIEDPGESGPGNLQFVPRAIGPLRV